MSKRRLKALVIVELGTAALAGLVAGWLVTRVGGNDPEIEFGFAFVATLHALVALVTAVALLVLLGLGLFAAITGRLPRLLGGEPVPRRLVVPAVLCSVLGTAIALALALA